MSFVQTQIGRDRTRLREGWSGENVYEKYDERYMEQMKRNKNLETNGV